MPEFDAMMNTSCWAATATAWRTSDLTGRNLCDAPSAFPEGGFAEGGSRPLVLLLLTEKWLGAVLHTVGDITCSTYCLKKFLGIELRDYVSVVKYFFLSLLACAPAFYVCTLSVSPWVSLSVGVVSAFALYWGLLHRDEHMKACLEVLIEAVGKRK